jgi:hypothetical protein
MPIFWKRGSGPAVARPGWMTGSSIEIYNENLTIENVGFSFTRTAVKGGPAPPGPSFSMTNFLL